MSHLFKNVRDIFARRGLFTSIGRSVSIYSNVYVHCFLCNFGGILEIKPYILLKLHHREYGSYWIRKNYLMHSVYNLHSLLYFISSENVLKLYLISKSGFYLIWKWWKVLRAVENERWNYLWANIWYNDLILWKILYYYIREKIFFSS